MGSPDKKNKKKKEQKDKEEFSSGGYFLGSVVSTSALSMLLTKYLFKVPLKKNFVASVGIGVMVGGM